MLPRHSADHTNFGSLDISSGSRTRTFTIQNAGGAALTLSGSSPYVAISGTAAVDFSIATPPAASIAAGGSTTFAVTFDPSATGTRSATLSIGSNDSDENPYNFSIQGDGFAPKNLVVSNITAPAGANGVYIHQGILYEFQYWMHESGSYYIYNDEFSGTRYWEIDTDTNDSASNFYSNDHGENASPVTVADWHVDTGSGGTPLIVYSGPEIAVEGNSIEISDGDVSPSAADHTDFGAAALAGDTVDWHIYHSQQRSRCLDIDGLFAICDHKRSRCGRFQRYGNSFFFHRRRRIDDFPDHFRSFEYRHSFGDSIHSQ